MANSKSLDLAADSSTIYVADLNYKISKTNKYVFEFGPRHIMDFCDTINMYHIAFLELDQHSYI